MGYLIGLTIGSFISSAIIFTISLLVVKRFCGHSVKLIWLAGLVGFIVDILLNAWGASPDSLRPEQVFIILLCFIVLAFLFISKLKKEDQAKLEAVAVPNE